MKTIYVLVHKKKQDETVKEVMEWKHTCYRALTNALITDRHWCGDYLNGYYCISFLADFFLAYTFMYNENLEIGNVAINDGDKYIFLQNKGS